MDNLGSQQLHAGHWCRGKIVGFPGHSYPWYSIVRVASTPAATLCFIRGDARYNLVLRFIMGRVQSHPLIHDSITLERVVTANRLCCGVISHLSTSNQQATDVVPSSFGNLGVELPSPRARLDNRRAGLYSSFDPIKLDSIVGTSCTQWNLSDFNLGLY